LVKSFLYGLERCEPGRELYLCEACWGVLWLYQHGVQAAALLGASLTEAQEALLEPYAEIRVCMDNDDAGRGFL
jgi:DNA primase